MPTGNIQYGDGYYSKNPASHLAEKCNDYESDLESFLLRQDPNIKLRIENAVKDSKVKIQAILRNETALRLKDSTGSTPIKVKVVSGLPIIVRRKLREIPKPSIPRVFLDKHCLQNAESGLQYLNHTIETFNSINSNITKNEVEKVLNYVHELLNSFNNKSLDKDIIDLMVKIDEDVLGAYFFNDAEIHLYWLVIGLFSYKYGVSPESLASVVAAHEWAHAYSHVGADTGGNRWDTEAFSSTSMTTVEGIAQYYSGLISERLSDECFNTYLCLLAQQSKPYRSHLEWFKDDANEKESYPIEDLKRWEKISSPKFRESVRFALLEARTGDRKFSQSFVDTLREVSDRLCLT